MFGEKAERLMIGFEHMKIRFFYLSLQMLGLVNLRIAAV